MTPEQLTAHARRISGFVWQTMNQRGMACARQDINTALVELAPAQLLNIETAALALAKGADGQAHFEMLAALRHVSAVGLRAALHAHAIEYRTELLLQHATSLPDCVAFSRACQQLQGANVELAAQASARLRGWLGPLLVHEDAPPVATSPVAPESEFSARTEQRRPAPPVPSKPPVQAPPVLPLPAPNLPALRRQCKVFGQSAALTWEVADLADQEANRPRLCTVMIEGAASDGEGHYGWDKKVVFMLTLRELPQVLGVLMGWSSDVEFRFHGRLKKKELNMVHQDHGLFIRLTDGHQRLAVPVHDADRYPLCMLVLAALCANEPTLDAHAVLSVCRALSRRYAPMH